MSLTDDELIDRRCREMAAYRALADYAARQRVGLLSRMREYALEETGRASSEDLLGQSGSAENADNLPWIPLTPPSDGRTAQYYSNAEAYDDAMMGWDIFRYLENFCNRRLAGHDYKSAAAESWNDMRVVQAIGSVMDPFRLESFVQHRNNYMDSVAGDVSPAVVEWNCIEDAGFALELVEKELSECGFFCNGHLAAINIAVKDLTLAIASPGNVAVLPQAIKECPETELIERFSAWLGGQKALSRVLESSVLSSQSRKQGDDSLPDTLKAILFYQSFCTSIQNDLKMAVDNGLYVCQFSQARNLAERPSSPHNPEHLALYQFIKPPIEEGIDLWCNEQDKASNCLQPFMRAANHLMQQFAQDFPIISADPVPAVKKISLLP